MKENMLEFGINRTYPFISNLDIDEVKKEPNKPLTIQLALWRSKEDFLVLMEDGDSNIMILLPKARLLRKKSFLDDFVNDWKKKNNLRISYVVISEGMKHHENKEEITEKP